MKTNATLTHYRLQLALSQLDRAHSKHKQDRIVFWCVVAIAVFVMVAV